ncbi:ATP-binding protein [Brevibacillus sp. H7]|uniref:ATP-binding protein n=1 Tax=Brevibacillus sp. H7 TaxID=3349138 RepID=UPI003810FC58
MRKAVNSADELIQMFQDLQSRAVKSGGSEKKTYSCLKCQDKEGYITHDDNGYERWTFCECHQQKRVDRLFKSSQITGNFQKLGFRTFKREERPAIIQSAYNCAYTYYKDFDIIKEKRQNSIALLGEPGAGKTHLLMAIANNLLKRGVGVSYFPWVEGFNEMKDNLDHLETRINRLQRVPVLFIDDLYKGRKEPTDFQIEQLFAIVNYRYLHNLPLMISSEYDIDQLCGFDKAIGSRIFEMARDYTVILRGDGLNYRISGGAAS